MIEWIPKCCETHFSNVKSSFVETHKYCQRREVKAVYVKLISVRRKFSARRHYAQ